MAAPAVQLSDFTTFSGLTLTASEQDRVTVLLGRAQRHLEPMVDPDLTWDPTPTATWTDAVSELAWFYWEREKSGVMEILSLPVSQLSLGTLFWTKEKRDSRSGLPSVAELLLRYGALVDRARVVLEGEVKYGVPF